MTIPAPTANRGTIAGRPLFEVFRDNQVDPSAHGADKLSDSLQTAAATGRPHEMGVQRYIVRDPQGNFVERYWRLINSPVHDDDGNLLCLVNQVEDVTAEVLGARRSRLEQTAAVTAPDQTP